MSDTPILTRRHLGLAAAAGAALAAAPALAQPGTAMGGDWLQQIVAHHRLVDAMFNQMPKTRAPDARGDLLMKIKVALSAHSAAEEDAIYPMVHFLGMGDRSEELYREQDQARLLLARLDQMPKGGDAFLTEFNMLVTAIREHVADEESNVYPKLKSAASAAQNGKMSMDYGQAFRRYAA